MWPRYLSKVLNISKEIQILASAFFLAVSLIGGILTFNAYVPQRRTGALAVPSFMLGWLVSELPLHHLAWQVIATALFLWAGALEGTTGWMAMIISLLSWAASGHLIPIANKSESFFEASLAAALGEDYRAQISSEWLERMEGITAPKGLKLNPFKPARSDVEVIRDIEYFPNGGKRNELDIYKPAGGTQGAPVLLQIHGGGWSIGSKQEQALPLMYHLAAQGWICVAINYRLSPQATFPDHLIDCKRAIGWIRQEISSHGGDPDFIAVTGGSAGGHLTAMVALTANDPEYQPGFEDVDTRVQAAVPFYGVYDFSDHFNLQPAPSMMDGIFKNVLKKDPKTESADIRRASPMHRIHAEAPPFLIIHGTNDGLAAIEEARVFAQRLQVVSNESVVFAEIPGAQHAFEIFQSIRTRATVLATQRFLAWALSSAKDEGQEDQ